MTTFGAYEPPSPQYKGLTDRSYYITMRDGVRIAVQVALPANLGAGEHIPALLAQTRYWRQVELRWPLSLFLTPDMLNLPFRDYKPFFTSHGYALITADVRGTGASSGAWPHPWDAASVQDAGEIVDWIVAQPWSNGMVAGTGVSYVGTTAELLAVPNRPAVKAILAMFNHPDSYTDISHPGGIYNQRFISAWSDMDHYMDLNVVPPIIGGTIGGILARGVRPVDGDEDRRLLAAAVEEHKGNGQIFEQAHQVVCRDDTPIGDEISMQNGTVHRYAPEIARAGVPIAGWASWMDAGTADAALRRFMTFDNCEWTVIGAWEHGGTMNASPYVAPRASVNPALPVQWREFMRFFDAYLKGMKNGVSGQKTLIYYTMGEEAWKQTNVWPPAGTVMQRWYMADEHALAAQPPTTASGADSYKVDFAASTGDRNRWWELGGIKKQTVLYPRRAEAGAHLLAYLTPPMSEDVEITGYPVVTLYVTSTESDGAFFVYLEDVAPDGHVTYITEGELRAIHRKVSAGPAPYKMLAPYHSFKRADVMPLVPGEVAELSFGLLPTSALIRRGHRIRIGIAGHDEGTFLRIPASGTPVITVARNSVHASRIDVPVVRKA